MATQVTISWNNWCKAFLDIMHRCIPYTSMPNRQNLLWLSKEIIQLMRKKIALFRRSKKFTSLALEYKRLSLSLSETPKTSSLVLSSPHIRTLEGYP